MSSLAYHEQTQFFSLAELLAFKATDLHEAFMCQCKTQTNEYTQSISDGAAKGEQLAASLTANTESKAQLQSDLKGHKSDREAAKKALADAKANVFDSI